MAPYSFKNTEATFSLLPRSDCYNDKNCGTTATSGISANQAENEIKRNLEYCFSDVVKHNLLRFSVTGMNWTAEYREPLDAVGKNSKWRFLCSGYYQSDNRLFIQRITLMLADKLRSVSQDINILLAEEKSLKTTTNSNNSMSIVSTVKKLALKATNPDEAALREACIHDDCGELTNEGILVLRGLMEADYKEKLVEVAKQIIAEQEKKN